MQKVCLVTGGSRGIGAAVCRALLARGCRVYALSRSGTGPDGVENLVGDVTDPGSVEAAMAQIAAREGRLDVLVCNAGTVISGSVEYIAPDAVSRLMALNFEGTAHCVRTAIPIMRASGGGRILCIASMAAAFPIAFHAYYSASKAAVTAFAAAVYNEVRPFNIGVCAVLPGDTKTNPVRDKFHEGDALYGGRISRGVAAMERDEQNGMDPDKVGRAIARIALTRRVGPAYTIGFVSKAQLFLKRFLPASFVAFVLRKLYA
ncbi:MAG TPA: SDR family NAD(P)-dependent oxidoreductase [Papillibacter sp.]|jgi:NAD(P)-dependent dehydrogenase (short-subunit alcohol dehydrogenase family)|nr:SDR family NAD(P)-dependent oxidoreductase [Papillibacter sp.]